MIEHIDIANFRCLRSISVPLAPLTVLIGANDTGKSAFLAALQLLCDERYRGPEDHWRLDTSGGLSVAARLAGKQKPSFFRITQQGVREVMTRGYPEPIAFVRLPSSGLSLAGVGIQDTGEPPTLDPEGSSLAALLDYMLRRERSRFDSFTSSLLGRVPGVIDIHIGTPHPSQRRIELQLENGTFKESESISVGLRAMMFYLALAYHPKPPQLILIEEPENGLHPARLKEVVELLRSITRGEHCGRAAQVVLTTHSPILLNYIDPEHERVLVFRRETDGSRTAVPVETDRIRPFLAEFGLGEVWLNEKEEGLTGAPRP